ncbi:hypothetical protein Tco_0044996 [Tanacetum coccineum]
MDNSFTLGSTEEVENVWILQSYNGLLLCTGSGWPNSDYVYNPSTYLYKRLSQPDYSHDDSYFYKSAGLRMAFHPIKSLDYKVVHARRTSCDIDIQIYSSETGNWSLCRDRFNYFSFDHFDSSIYWNDAFHWLETENTQLTHYKLNIGDHDHPIITTIKISHGLHWGRNFLESYGYMDPIDDIGSKEFTIYEMMNGCYVWSKGKRILFSVINLSGNVIKYNLISKTMYEIYDMGSNQVDDDDDDEFIPPFSIDHNLYEFIPSFASL